MRFNSPPVQPLSWPEGRLTLTSATPVLAATVSATGTVYYTPYQGNQIPIWNGVFFQMMTFAELSNVLANSSAGSAGPAAVANNSNYDLFVWNNAGTLTLSRGPLWTSDTGRGSGAGTTQLTLQGGILVNTVAITNGPGAGLGTYVGSFRSNGTATTDMNFGAKATNGTAALINVWNCYNRVNITPFVKDSTASWTYGTATVRAANGSNGNRISCMRGLDEDQVEIKYTSKVRLGLSGAFITGICVGNTNNFDQNCVQAYINNTSAALALEEIMPSFWTGIPGLGFRFFQAVEQGDGATTTTVYGVDYDGLGAVLRA